MRLYETAKATQGGQVKEGFCVLTRVPAMGRLTQPSDGVNHAGRRVRSRDVPGV